MRTILVFGNELVEDDALAVSLLPLLRERFKDIRFLHRDGTDEVTEFGRNLEILDVAKNITEPLVITDLAQLKTLKVTSMHDFDLAYNLKLLKTLGKIDTVKLFVLPHDYAEERAVAWLEKELK